MRYFPLARGFELASPFGWRTWPDGSRDFHAGADFGWPGGSAGQPIYACQSGTVLYAGGVSGYGGPDPAGWLVIDSTTAQGGGCAEYGHLIREVGVGDHVQAGQRIGHVNPDTNTNGGVAPHCHLSVMPAGYDPSTKIDPIPWLGAAAYAGETPTGGPVTDTVFADVSYFQAKVDDSYPYRVLSIRSNDGTFRDPNFSHNYQWCVNAVNAGRLDCFIVYAYWRPNWQDTANTMRDMVTAEGGPHPRMVAMVDLESGGNPGGDQSGGVNAWCDNIAGWLGTPSGGGRVIGYGNQGDLGSMWPHRPAGMRMVVAGYGGASPSGFPGFLAHQYTNGGGYGAPAPQGCPPFGNCDMNSADGLDPAGFCAAVGLGAAPAPSLVGGAIGDLYNTLGGPGGFLGNPTTPENKCADGVGRYNHFDRGSIYWTPTTGAHEVHGALHAAWAAQGWETGKWGYPISNEVPCSEGSHQYFQGVAVFYRTFTHNITELT